MADGCARSTTTGQRASPDTRRAARRPPSSTPAGRLGLARTADCRQSMPAIIDQGARGRLRRKAMQPEVIVYIND